jgi:uroporphyrinogen decarboxylase
MMTRKWVNALLHYESVDQLPVMHFGFWPQTLEKWIQEGHITEAEYDPLRGLGQSARDGTEAELRIAQKLGFDDNVMVYIGQKTSWYHSPLYPPFEQKIVRQLDDNHFVKIDCDGVFVEDRQGAQSIAAEIDHSAKNRESWEKNYAPRLTWKSERLDMDAIGKLIETNETRTRRVGLHCGSLIGKLRNYWGLVSLSYLQIDDPELFDECIHDMAEICFLIAKKHLETGVKVDFAHFWEDICFNNGPLINPKMFREKIGPHYRRITDECAKYGIDIVSVDCDGFIEDLVPVWLDNGINTMFPIEYGTWEYSFKTLREKFGRELRGIGNVNKKVFSMDKKAVDCEVDRVKRLVDLGGFVPCPDHRIAPDAEWDLVAYYCERMREA